MTNEHPESCWFIERQRWFDSQPHYLSSYENTVDHLDPRIGFDWKTDPLEAMSFNRRRDAEAFILAHHELCVLGHAVCHGFMQGASS